MASMKGKPMAENFEAIAEELKQPVEKTLAKLAEQIYYEKTGKDWRKEPPDEVEAQVFVRLAARRLIEKWHRVIKDLYGFLSGRLIGKPAEWRKLVAVVKRPTGERLTVVLPVEQATPEKLPPESNLVCPKCGVLAMKPISRGIWRCINCGYALSLLSYFKPR
ncbi:MAG: hypothetical protein QXZ68_05515 [Candidatus Bathyarchaeia archaeon]